MEVFGIILQLHRESRVVNIFSVLYYNFLKIFVDKG